MHQVNEVCHVNEVHQVTEVHHVNEVHQVKAQGKFTKCLGLYEINPHVSKIGSPILMGIFRGESNCFDVPFCQKP